MDDLLICNGANNRQYEQVIHHIMNRFCSIYYLDDARIPISQNILRTGERIAVANFSIRLRLQHIRIYMVRRLYEKFFQAKWYKIVKKRPASRFLRKR